MTTARRNLVSVDATPYYHCVSRCVRRSFLCGVDELTNISYEHRRAWIEAKIYSLTHTYCIDVCAYAVMSNHFHVVLHINRNSAQMLTPEEVIERWGLTHKIPELIKKWQQNQITNKAEHQKCLEIVEVWRERLWSLSWFMKELNYDIACRANQEDNCSGHFWESRFKSQALLDEKALAAAMAYVDLNPVRAGVAKTPESSEFTSIKARIKALRNDLETAPCLHPFVGITNDKTVDGLPFRLIEYIELVDWSARQLRPDKCSIDSSLPPILNRLNISRVSWLKACTQLEKRGATAIGDVSIVKHVKVALNKSKLHLYQIE
ncbi:transposase [Vibrio sp. SCSIO 43136]|uniref:transposase n=1 Tax=Vibrio sp. SCSIO 43136 TaxID=2819101 RepID=UPI002075ABF1|nr:transposase [Vibrio sp. SCSIO 43136]USD67425.1 transposase [Vibrio sp. SCSIO 43136]